MATLTKEQVEQKMQQLKQLAEEVNALKNELVEAGAWPLDEEELDKVVGGFGSGSGGGYGAKPSWVNPLNQTPITAEQTPGDRPDHGSNRFF